MKVKSPIFLFAALVLILLNTACSGTATATSTPGGSDVTPSAVVASTGTATSATGEGTETATPEPGAGSATATGSDGTPAISETPGTPSGTQQAPLLQQVAGFCVEGLAHVVLTIPDAATFEVSMLSAAATALPEPGITCDSVRTVAGKDVLLCGGPPNISFNLEVCEGNNCRLSQVNLPACGGTDDGTPGAATPGATAVVPSPTVTMTPGIGTLVPTIVPSLTP